MKSRLEQNDVTKLYIICRSSSENICGKIYSNETSVVTLNLISSDIHSKELSTMSAKSISDVGVAEKSRLMDDTLLMDEIGERLLLGYIEKHLSHIFHSNNSLPSKMVQLNFDIGKRNMIEP